MPWSIVQGDISNLSFPVDAIVNVAHPNKEKIGLGVDRAIHRKAGPGLLNARIGKGDLERGQSVLSMAYGLNANYVIHTLGPYWRDGAHGEEAVLRRCYDTALDLALGHRCQTIAFPLIASGNQGFPVSIAYRIATDAFRDFCETHSMKLYLVVFDEKTAAYCRRQRSVRRDRLPQDIGAAIASEYEEEGTCSSPEEVRQRIQAANALHTQNEDAIDRILEQNLSNSIFDTLDQLVIREMNLSSISSTVFCQDKANLHAKHYLNQISGHKKKDTHSRLPKATLLAYAVGLRLNLRQTAQLLRQGEYLFPSSSKRDQIVADFLRKGCWDIQRINAELYAHQQPILGSNK